MPSILRLLSLTLVLTAVAACTHAGPSAHESRVSTLAPAGLVSPLGSTAPVASLLKPVEKTCAGCAKPPLPPEIARVVERRLDELKARGGSCSEYGSVLESSYRSGRIAVRPFMWRVGRQLVSGEARPNGEMTLAMEIDSLNVGVRTVDEVLWSMEHEAVHIAFDIASGTEGAEERANRYVRECRA